MKNRIYIAIVSLVLAVLFTAYIALDTFVIPHVYEVVDSVGVSAVNTKADNENVSEAEDEVMVDGLEEKETYTKGSEAPADSEKEGVAIGMVADISGIQSEDAEDYSGQTNTESAESSETTEVETTQEDTVETSEEEVSDSSGESGGSRRGRYSHNNSEDGNSRHSSSSDESDTETETTSVDLSTAESSSESYSDENIIITLSTYRAYDTDIYVADIIVSSAEYLKTAFAKSSYGKNVTDTTSNMANENNAILAINGDYYGVQESGYVIRNGKLYRSTKKGNQEDIVIYRDGSMAVINENDITAEELLENGAEQVLCFGPGLIQNNEIIVSTNDEVSKALYSNPRTAIGMIGKLHYVFVVADGRTDQSEGLSLFQLASFMKTLGAETAYNLDGGGSSTMVFNNKVVNNPTSSGVHGWGSNSSERSVSDIVYIGY